MEIMNYEKRSIYIYHMGIPFKGLLHEEKCIQDIMESDFV